MEDEYYSHSRSFVQVYHCYPLSHIEKSHLENGDKIIMPPSALDCLAYMMIDYPMIFELHNHSAGRVSHCGVLEFSSEEGSIFIPNWMMENMQLQEGDLVMLKNASLRKGTYMKLQPHTKDFTNLSNPRAVLETTLRNFTCLTSGDTIMITHNNKNFYLDIIETKPTPAIRITDTDCEVDFAPPLDYEEPEKPVPPVTSKNATAKAEEQPAEEQPKFRPFTGVSRRLDGKPSTELAAPIFSPLVATEVTSKKSQSNFRSEKKSGKVVFSSNVIQAPKKSTEHSKENVKAETLKNEEPKTFQPFSGKKYTLTD